MNAIPELTDASPEALRRIDALRATLRAMPELHNADGREADRIRIYCWRDEENGGLRISEIGLSWDTPTGTAGSSWMASDLDAGAVIFAAERYLLMCLFDVIDHGHGTIEDPEQEHRRGLIHAITRDYNGLPEWEEREHNPLAMTPGDMTPDELEAAFRAYRQADNDEERKRIRDEVMGSGDDALIDQFRAFLDGTSADDFA